MNKLPACAILAIMLSVGTLFAQNYTTDAMLLEKAGNTITVQSSGVSAKKKDATELAVKSALYTYLFMGIDGLNFNRPLLGINPSQEAKEYGMQILNSTRYATFVKKYTVDEAASKTLGNNYQAIVTVEIYDASLIRDLVSHRFISQDPGTISIVQIQEQIALPTIMAVPYCASNETFLDAIKRNPDVRIAIAKIREGFISQRADTKDFEQMLRNAETYQARQGDMSLNDMVISNSMADVIVYVDISKNANAQGLQVTLRLSAVAQATANVIAEKVESSGRFNATTERICGALADNIKEEFLKQIATKFAEKSNAITINFTIDPNAYLNMDSEVGSDMLPLSDLIIQWVKRNAKEGKYHQKGRSDTLLALDEILIENTNGMDINDFSLELYRFMRSLNLSIKRDIVGSTIEITIQ